jgi:hypothetical protein
MRFCAMAHEDTAHDAILTALREVERAAYERAAREAELYPMDREAFSPDVHQRIVDRDDEIAAAVRALAEDKP